MAILPLPLQPFHLEKKKEHSQGKIRAKIPLRVRSGLKSHKQDIVKQSLALQDKAKSPIVNVNGL